MSGDLTGLCLYIYFFLLLPLTGRSLIYLLFMFQIDLCYRNEELIIFLTMLNVDNLIDLMRDPLVSCLLRTVLSFLTSICLIRLMVLASSLAAPAFVFTRSSRKSSRSGSSRLVSQLIKQCLRQKILEWPGFEPLTLGVVIFYADH